MEAQISEKKWVLLVDDDAEIVEMLAERLRMEGLGVIPCRSESEALRKLSNQEFSCIIVDLNLGESGSGSSLIKTIRQDKEKFNYFTPIILISAELGSEVFSSIVGKIDDALVKPFGIPEFLARVMRQVGDVGRVTGGATELSGPGRTSQASA